MCSLYKDRMAIQKALRFYSINLNLSLCAPLSAFRSVTHSKTCQGKWFQRKTTFLGFSFSISLRSVWCLVCKTVGKSSANDTQKIDCIYFVVHVWWVNVNHWHNSKANCKKKQSGWRKNWKIRIHSTNEPDEQKRKRGRTRPTIKTKN